MFKCKSCGRKSMAGEKSFLKVTETRPVSYTNGGRSSNGSEIVKEIRVCSKCV